MPARSPSCRAISRRSTRSPTSPPRATARPPRARPNLPATLLTLEGVNGPEYWIGYQNFYVITRYNRSPMYAMAVHQLAQAIAAPSAPAP
jgi:membrane-bound lytic murein transglycosylase B